MNAQEGTHSVEPHIVALEMADGDPGYFAYGHISKGLFVGTVNAEYGEEFEESDAQHVYQTAMQPARFTGKPDRYGEGDNYWWICNADEEGAFACTFVRPV